MSGRGVVTTSEFTEAERAAWEVAVDLGLAITALDLRCILKAATPWIAAEVSSACRHCGRTIATHRAVGNAAACNPQIRDPALASRAEAITCKRCQRNLSPALREEQ